MDYKQNSLLYCFGAISFANIVAVGLVLDWLNYLTKPLLISCLALWYFQSIKKASVNYTKAFLAGLCFSVLGDILLMFVKTQGELYFMLGLGSFLLAHLSYIIAFSTYPSSGTGAISINKIIVLPFIVVFVAAAWFLWADLGALKIPVTVYSLVIIAMSAFSFNMRNRVSKSVSGILFFGAVMFVASDFTIALAKFKYSSIPQPISGLVVMVTYLLGQFLLTKGMAMAASETQKPR